MLTFLREKLSCLDSTNLLVEWLWSNSRSEIAGSSYKRRGNWRETHASLWPFIGRIMWTKIVRLLDVSFFTCGKHRSLLWLAKTHLRIKIYDIAFQWESKYMLFACREVRIGENCTRVLDYWGHSFSYTDRPSRQMTYLFFPTNKIFMNILLQPTQFMLYTCVDMARDQMQNQN